MKRLILYVVGILFLAGCSATKHLPEGETLYTGQKTMVVENRSTTLVGEIAMEGAETALATAPDNSLLGSSSIRIPFPMGLWMYNGFVKYEKGFGRWIFGRFAAKPILMSFVNPNIRQKAAANLLRDYNYFNGTVSYKIFLNPKDPLKVKIQYTVDMRNPYFIDTVYYHGFSKRTLQIMNMSRRRSLISPGEQFNMTDLDGERTRISTLLYNVGCYYFRPDYLTYQAGTTLVPGGYVTMRVVPVPGMPAVTEKPFYVDKRAFYPYRKQGQAPNNSMGYEGLCIYYHDKLRVCPNMVYRWPNYQAYRQRRQVQDSTGIPRRRSMQNLYSLYRQTRVQERLNNVGIFRYLEMQYTPCDTTFMCDTLDMDIHVALDKPYGAELDFNVKMKSNNQTGPGASFTVTKDNVFGGGEVWNVKLGGLYEWQTGKDRSSTMNSYEMGLSTSLMFPRVVFPRFDDKEYDFPATTTFKLCVDQLNRAKYYKLLAFGGNAAYGFQPKRTSKHSFTPFRLTFNVLRNPTEVFKELQAENLALYVNLRDQFIPAIEYMYTYDNAPSSYVRDPIRWQTTVSSASNLTSYIYCIFGKLFSEQDKGLMDVPLARFLKVNGELCYHYKIDKNQLIASRIAGGVIWSYGNALAALCTEQFYIGGANSVRASSARNIGSGGYAPNKESEYSFINHMGDIRLEANVEYRFRIIGDLHGTVSLDAGNVWLMRKDDSRPNGELSLKNFAKQIALDAGAGLRYDMDFLVFRLDCGVGLHDPYETGKSGYYNIPKFKDSLALHSATGYPF